MVDLQTVRVPGETILFIGITACVTLLLPIVAAIIYGLKTKAKALSAVLGALTFLVFALLLEQGLHTIVLGAAGTAITGNIWLYALYGGLCAGVFEETGRFVTMKFLMKKTLDRKNAIMYGIGHGGFEAMAVVGLTMISNLIICFTLNAGLGSTLVAALPAELVDATIAQISPLWTLPSSTFLVSALERILAMTLHILLSYLVYRAVKYKKPIFFIFAVFYHFLVDAGTVIASAFTSSVLVLELIVFVLLVILLVIDIILARKEDTDTELQTPLA